MSEQTNEQIAARAISGYLLTDKIVLGPFIGVPSEYDKIAAAVVKALADAGRLVPPGHFVTEVGQWDRTRYAIFPLTDPPRLLDSPPTE